MSNGLVKRLAVALMALAGTVAVGTAHAEGMCNYPSRVVSAPDHTPVPPVATAPTTSQTGG